MIHLLTVTQITKRSLLLGLLALLLNLAVRLFFPDTLILPGYLAVIIAAAVFGLTGAFYTVAIGVVPDSIIFGDELSAIRLSILAFSLALFSKQRVKIPICLVGGLIWILLYSLIVTNAAPVLLTLDWLKLGLAELVILAGANLLIINQAFHLKLCSQPTSMPTTTVTMQAACSIILTVCCCLGWTITIEPSLVGLNGSHLNISQLAVFLIVILIIALSLLGGCLIAYLVSSSLNSYEANITSGLLHGATDSEFNLAAKPSWQPEDQQGQTELPLRQAIKTGIIDRNANSAYSRSCHLTINRAGVVIAADQHFATALQISKSKLIGMDLNKATSESKIIPEIVAAISYFKTGKQLIREFRIEDSEGIHFYELTVNGTAKQPVSSSEADLLELSLLEITAKRHIDPAILLSQKLTIMGTLSSDLASFFERSCSALNELTHSAEKPNSDPKLKASFNQIEQAVKIANETADYFIEFAKQLPGETQITDLPSLISEQVRLLEQLFGSNNPIELILNGDPLEVLCDPVLIRQALTNLAINARESYLGKAGKIKISLDTETIAEDLIQIIPEARVGKFARLRVKDCGCGMTPDLLKKAFDPLANSVSDCTSKSLMLSAVYTIVRANDGFLTTESCIKRGTQITIYLPLANQAELPAFQLGI